MEARAGDGRRDRFMLSDRRPAILIPHDSGSRAAYGGEQGVERRAMEECFSRGEAQAFEGVWNALASPDPFIRHAARVGLEAAGALVGVGGGGDPLM